jgi:hypothetical protein
VQVTIVILLFLCILPQIAHLVFPRSLPEVIGKGYLTKTRRSCLKQLNHWVDPDSDDEDEEDDDGDDPIDEEELEGLAKDTETDPSPVDQNEPEAEGAPE